MNEDGGEAPEPDPQPDSGPVPDPIAPVAPRIQSADNLVLAEVSASPAFQCLDDLFQEGNITGTRVAHLKSMYTQLHDLLREKRQREIELTEEIKVNTADLERQAMALDKADGFPEGYTDDASQLRIELLKHMNELDLSNDRIFQLDYKVNNLSEERDMLDREYGRMPKKDEIDKQIKDLNDANDGLEMEITQRKAEAKMLREDLDSKNRQLDLDRREFRGIFTVQEDLKNDLVMVHTKPGQISKEIDKLLRSKLDFETELNTLQQNYDDLHAAVTKGEENLRSLEGDKNSLQTKLDRQRTQLDSKQRDFDGLQKEYDYAKEKCNILLGDSATLDLSIRHIMTEKKGQHDLNTRMTREKDQALKNLKKIELQLKVSRESLNVLGNIQDKAKNALDLQPKDDGSFALKQKELLREVEATKRALAHQNSMTAMESMKVEQAIKEQQKLRYAQSDYKIQDDELNRVVRIKSDEREDKSRELMKAELRYQRVLQELKTRKLAIGDNYKKFQDMQAKLSDFAKLYEVIKNERNKCVNLIQTSQQKAAEMREKIKILDNEVEILRSAVIAKERQLQKSRLKHMNGIVIRDGMRNELSKRNREEREMAETRDQQRLDLAKLNMMLNATEQHMVQLRKRFETGVESRNNRGIELIERNEEVCILYEKINMQDMTVRNGEVEIQAREEELRFLKVQVQELNRIIGLLRKEVPVKDSLEKEVEIKLIQHRQMQHRMLELEELLEDADTPARVRYLSGSDGNPEQLNNHMEHLEIRLAQKEEALLEKELLFEQVFRLCERVKNKSTAGKEDTLNLAKKVNEYQSKIKEVTRKIMARVSELSMYQAQAIKLQQEVREKESDLEQSYIRMERGEAPTEEALVAWRREIRLEKMRMRDKEAAEMERDADEQIAAGVEPRPNAYIPAEPDALPIPRPYGAHPPFKPQDPGSNIRHIRKPIVKPIEI